MDAQGYLEISDIEGLAADRKRRILSIIKKYNRGTMTAEEREDEIEKILINESSLILDNLLPNRTQMTYEQAARLVSDYKVWKAGGEMDRDFYTEDLFSKLCSLLVPISLLKKMDPDIPTPQLRNIHTWHGCSAWNVMFECVDDGGLLGAVNPVGETYRLVREDGVGAVVKVTGYFKQGEPFKTLLGEMGLEQKAEVYQCLGTIEDYSFASNDPERPNIEICVRDNRITYLTVYSFHVIGRSAVSVDFPRWKRYLEKCDEMNKELMEEIKAFS